MKPKPHRRLPKPRRANPVLHAMGVSARLAALLVALATPAWAANDEKPQPYAGRIYSVDGVDWPAYSLCRRTNDTLDICMMLHSTEVKAREWAGLTLDVCEQGWWRVTPDECAASRAYIKQRWGY